MNHLSMKRTIILIAMCFIVTLVLININDLTEKSIQDDEHLARILDEIWDEYGILAYSALTTDSALYFVVDDHEDKDEVAHSIEKKLEQHDIEEYSLEIYKDYEVAFE